MSDTVRVPIRFKLTAEDYTAFNRYHGRKQLALLFVFYWGLFLFIAMFRGAQPSARSLIIMLPAGLLFAGLLIGFHLWTIQRKTRQMFANDKHAQLEQLIELTDEGVRQTTGDTTESLAWTDIGKAIETANGLFLYVTSTRAFVIPKRDVTDWARLREVLRLHLPAAKLRLKTK
jgi:hypothetical protein